MKDTPATDFGFILIRFYFLPFPLFFAFDAIPRVVLQEVDMILYRGGRLKRRAAYFMSGQAFFGLHIKRGYGYQTPLGKGHRLARRFIDNLHFAYTAKETLI